MCDAEYALLEAEYALLEKQARDEINKELAKPYVDDECPFVDDECPLW